jgi:hypothetical protein
MAIVTTTNEAVFAQSAEQVYDFVSNPGNWPQAYPGSVHEEGLSPGLPLNVGDTWTETGPQGELYSWHVAIAVRPRIWVCSTFGPIGHARDGSSGIEGRITVQYRFLRPSGDITLFQRTMTVETYRESPMPDSVFASMNPTQSEIYFANIRAALEAGPA